MKLKCSACLEEKDTGEFSADSGRKRGYQYRCKSCHNKYLQEWYIKNSDKQKLNAKSWKEANRSRVLATKYGVSVQEIEDLLAVTNKTCPICRRSMLKPHLDHDHRTGRLRAFICGQCNIMLGLASEDVETLHNAISYLEMHALVVQRTEWDASNV